MKRDIIVIAHDIRSCLNVGSIFRTAEGLGISKLYLTGYTPFPEVPKDRRLPHERKRITKQIDKTALGATQTLAWSHSENVIDIINELKAANFTICGLEQTKLALRLPDYRPTNKIAIILGNEVTGIEEEVIDNTDLQLVVPMFGEKESFNVVQAAAMALYHCRFTT